MRQSKSWELFYFYLFISLFVYFEAGGADQENKDRVVLPDRPVLILSACGTSCIFFSFQIKNAGFSLYINACAVLVLFEYSHLYGGLGGNTII